MDGRDLQIYNERTIECQDLRREVEFLRSDRDWLRVHLFHADQRHSDLKAEKRRLVDENRQLALRVVELTTSLQAASAAGDDNNSGKPPLKPSLPARRLRKKSGRKTGHPAALRPMPEQIDVHQDAPLPKDPAGRASCPHCNACLLDLQDHERIVEDIVPAKVVVTCYHTCSGWCPGCRKRIESRAPEQPPAANIPHGQLGINALATAIVLHITHRLPFRQVSQVFADLPGLTVCPGAITRQVQRIADWLENDYEHLMRQLRSAPIVHADETSWRTDGKNGYLWVATTPTQTLYHIDHRRSGEVIRKLLGETFDGTLVSDYYSAYAAMNCKKQKCLVHLLRELRETSEKSAAFAGSVFFRKTKRLIKEMLLLKGRWDEMSDERYTTRVCRLETRLDELAGADYDEPEARRIGQRLRKFKKELTPFLWERALDGTNNAAERAVRPVVVARKISGGSRSDKGAEAFAKLASLLRTAGQQGQNVLSTIRKMLVAAWATGTPAVVPEDSTAESR